MNETVKEICEICKKIQPNDCDGHMRGPCDYFGIKKTALYFQSVVIPAERAAARKELIDEIDRQFKEYASCKYNEDCEYSEDCIEGICGEDCIWWQQLKGEQ